MTGLINIQNEGNVLDGAWLDQGLFWSLIECSTHKQYRL